MLGLVRRIRNKANAVAVLSPKFENLRRMCDDVLQSAPGEGLIEGIAFLQVSALLGFCTEPENILADQAIDFDPLDVEAPAETQAAAAEAEAGVDTQQQLGIETVEAEAIVAAETAAVAEDHAASEAAEETTESVQTDTPVFEF